MKKKIAIILTLALAFSLSGCFKGTQGETKGEKEKMKKVLQSNKRSIYLAGGCFWGVEGFFKGIDGVFETTTGYANGKSEKTDYESLKDTDHAETVKVEYDISRVTLEEILLRYFTIIDPKSVDKQGNDIGRQYRTGIYYENSQDRKIIDKIMNYEKKKHGKLAVEVAVLKNFKKAEEYHQDYLDKNPRGYCHVNIAKAKEPLMEGKFLIPDKEEMKKRLDDISFNVIYNSATEKPFSSPLNKEHRKGIYVDKVSGEPLFASKDKFDSGCGWPSFSKPISDRIIKEKKDQDHGMIRTEVRSKRSDAHLGHVFDDGPKEKGGLRYCINGASLKFIPYDEMKAKGYEKYMILCE